MKTSSPPRFARLLPLLALATAACGLTDVDVRNGDEALGSRSGALTVAAAPMSIGRYQGAAARLADGTVLAVGGRPTFSNTALASAEIYTPSTNSWAPTGSLNVARRSHSAVTLPDGRVLVIGGFGLGGVLLRSCELYDPATASWSLTGDMAVARYEISALRLSDGRVMIAGGPTMPAQIELFDPATGTWSTTAPMGTLRNAMGLVELSDGRVLSVGGMIPNSGGAVTTCELWSPATGTWSATGSTNAGRYTGDMGLARLPGGKVLVTGYSQTAELYDPTTGQWTYTGAPLARHIYGVGVQLDDGTFLYGAGRNLSGPTNTLERYDAVTGTWSVAEQLTAERSLPLAVPLADGGALLAGGYVLSQGNQGVPVGLASVDRVQPPPCVTTLSPASVSFPSEATAGTVDVMTAANCAWTVQSAPAWVSVLGPLNGTGPGTVNYTVVSNSDAPRSGTININGATQTVSQSAGPCFSPSLTPAGALVGGGVSTGTVMVVTGAGCPWTVLGAPSWITITSGLSGTGSGYVGYTVAANPGSTRSATLTIAGVAFTLQQQPGASYEYATYSATRRAPVCTSVAYACDTGTLVNGRAGLGPEANAPNTLGGTCVDGTAGSYHYDESVDRVRVSTSDGSAFAPGKTVIVEVTAWIYSYSSNRIDIYSAPNADAPLWTYRGTLVPPGNGLRTVSTSFVLPAGANQVVRAQERYLGTATACTSGPFNDRDDVVFAVGP